MYEGICYQKPFLKQAIVRLDFVAPIPGVEKALSPKFAKVLSDNFPIVEPKDAVEHQLEIKLGATVEHRDRSFTMWNFYGKEREKQFTLSSQFLFIAYTEYISYEEMKRTFIAIVTALEAAYPDTRVGRFGLRYVNNIEIERLSPVSGWSEYISAALLSVIPFFDPERLTRLVQIAEMKCGDMDLRFQFGLPNPDFPAVIKRPSFVLDLDAYIQAAHDLSGSPQYMDQGHSCIQKLFESSITDKLRERMDVKTAAAVQK